MGGIKRGLIRLAAFTILASPAAAHHASAPHFDRSKPITIEGVVTQFRLVNPHAYLYLDVTDADGNVDVLVAINSTDSITVSMGSGATAFGPPQSYAAGNGPSDIALADFNDDGLLDFVVSNRHAGAVTVSLNRSPPGS